MKNAAPSIIASLLAAFGLITLFLSSSLIFDLFDFRAKEGAVVFFVVWANFISSFLYLAAAYGILKARKWTIPVLAVAAMLLVAAFMGLMVHISNGSQYETQTKGALIFRIILTIIFTLSAYFYNNQKIKMRTGLFILLMLAFVQVGKAQDAPFQIVAEPFNINGLAGVQAFVYGQHEGKWLILGGRTDGLHRRQPWATFDTTGQNTQLTVVDPVAMQIWSAPISTLPVGIREQLNSTNMEFHQEGDYLYIVGGYGFSNTADDHITYPNITAVEVSSVINAIVDGASIGPFFRQITDERMAVTGGYLNKIYDTFYLTGGQRFDGRYNPMGNPTYVQEYTNAIRKFTIEDDGTTFSVTHQETITDTVNLHRRDYNVIPQILPDGQQGLTAFSGVFQVSADLPYLNCVNIDSGGYMVNNDFAQYYNHYHCANIPLYSMGENEMHNLFFGGIAQYYDSVGILVQDNNVPFVRTIARVTRNGNGSMAEYKLPAEMPALLGAGSEFIAVENLPEYPNGVLRLDELTADTTLLGYIYGGINSTEANIFWVNDGTQSTASSLVFRILLVKNVPVGVHSLNPQSTGSLHLQVYPNPATGSFMLKFNLKNQSEVRLRITDATGKRLENSVVNNLNPGENSLLRYISDISNGGIWFITLETRDEKATQKIIIKP